MSWPQDLLVLWISVENPEDDMIHQVRLLVREGGHAQGQVQEEMGKKSQARMRGRKWCRVANARLLPGLWHGGALGPPLL